MHNFPSSLKRARTWRRPCTALVAAGGALAGICWSGSAAAANTLGIDLSFNDSTQDSRYGTNTGAGVDVFFGPRMDLGLVALTTELDAGYHDFGGAADPTVYRGMAGGRLAIGAVVRPSVFAHIGVGNLRWNTLPGISDDRDSRTNLATDLGVGLDFTLLPLVDLGLQLSYNSIAGGSATPAFDWAQVGAHVIFVFGS
jgi:opacity protein-like surface antigen